MEYHFVPLEERAKDEKGNLLPWGYVYKDESRNPRRPPEESGPFGRRRNARYDHARSRARTGTPARRENPNVAEFSRLFTQQLHEEEKSHSNPSKPATSTTLENTRPNPHTEKVATECILYGYRSKDSEWKVIDKFERISQGFICEDYPRTDPNLTSSFSELLSGGDIVIRANLSADANRKSKRYAGGFHWIKITFDSRAAADRAIFFSPQEIDGHFVFCRLYDGQGPGEDIPLPVGSDAAATALQPHGRNQQRPISTSLTTPILQTKDKDRLFAPHQSTNNNLLDIEEESSQLSTATASSTTATGIEQPSPPALRQRQAQPAEPKPASEYMSHVPAVRKAELRPMNEALPPQPTVTERVLRSIPILSWFTGDIVGDGPQLREDGSFDYDKSNVYWRFWYMVDRIIGTDICGLKEEL
ncbi:hypothetical protein MPDQ_004544 [Monascus purpureus]|uniref:Uncharacterized protein n=1 Tax=Monascus purpureus TaxID=5098 RepID=A0A507R649_MONPU|nr:hypothetical protein MPDQ_004544 [Monascus purpureus]BDD61641.1 hypothetical protein MAP00_006679 [Monascus purpureus]